MTAVAAPPSGTEAIAPATASAPDQPVEREGAEHRYLIAVAVVLASLMQVIDSSIVNVALPDMMGTFGANLDEIAWVSTGYILASVIVIPLTGWLGSFFGRKRYFVGSIVLFTMSSFFCGAAHSLATLVLWRVVQGIGGGALMTVSQAVLFESFPRKEAGMAMALFGLGVMVGPTIGPTLGGWLTDNYGWPWIFYVNLPIGIVAAVMIATYVHDPEHQRKPPSIDYQGIALLAIAAGGLQYVLEYGQRDDWYDSSLITSLTVISTIAGLALLWRELTTRTPVIDFRVLKHRQMWVGTLLGVVMGIGLYAMSFTLPVFLQSNLHMTAMQAGITMLPGALATAVSMWIVGRLMPVVDARISIMLGALLFAAAAWDLSTITSASGQVDFFWPLIGRGVGLGLMFVPLTTITLAELNGSELAQGAGLYNFFRQLGGSFGIAVIASLLTRYTTQTRAVLGTHVAMGDATSLARIRMMTQAMIGHGSDPVAARQQALTLLDRAMYGQASVIAYSRIYVISAVLMLSLIPLLVLVRETRRPSGAQAIVE